MSDAPLRNHEWFWDEGDEHKLYPLEALVEMYYGSAGHNSTLIVGLTPDRHGRMPEADVQRCREWGREMRRRFARCVAEGRGEGEELIIELAGERRFEQVVLQEEIQHGERVRRYRIEVERPQGWQAVAAGSCIGHKRIHRLDAPVEARRLRLRIDEAVAPPRIARLALYTGGD